MSAIRNYSVIVEHSPEDLVRIVTKALVDGFQPVGGISIAQESANPKKGTVAPRIVYAQAMVRLYTAQDAIGQVVTRVNGA